MYLTSDAEGIEISGFDSSTIGEKTVIISYGGISKEVTVTIHESATLEVVDPRTEYYLYDSDFESPTSQVVYDDGAIESASPTFSGFDCSKVGTCEITASYRNLNTTYTITISGTMTANIGEDNVADIVAILDIQAETLTISGTGATKTIETPSNSWGNYTGGIFGDGPKHYEYVKEVIIEEGITEIYGLCNSMTELVKITLPDSLTCIERNTFSSCSKLPEIIIPKNCVTIGEYAFNLCQNATVTILNKDAVIFDSQYTFYEVPKIKGHYGSSAQSYADTYNYTFESIDTITKLQITKKPDRILHVGERLNVDDLEVKITLDTGEETVVTIYTLEYDFSSAGEKTVTVTIENYSDSFTVNVAAYAFSELVNTTDGMQAIRSTKNDDGTDTIDGVDWFKFNNTTADKIYVSGNNWIGFGVSSEQLKICRRDGAVWNVYRQETALDNDVKVLKIRVEGYTYYSGSGEHESQIKYELFLFDNGDMYLNMIQSPASTSSYAGTSSLICNSKTTELSLNGATEESPVQVTFLHQDESGLDWNIAYRAYRFATLTGIKVTALPDKTKYKVNETFDSSGLTVAAVYDDDESEAVTDYTLSEPDMSSYGTKSIIVTYESFTTTFDIMVIDAAGIEVTDLPTKTQYYEDDIFVPDGITVSQVYTDGSKEKVTGYSLSAPNMSAGGKKTVTVTYNEFTTTFTINVIGISGIEITKEPSKKEYYVGDSLDTTELAVILKYTDGTSKSWKDYEISGFDNTTAGEKTVTISYKTHTATFKAVVYSASGIRIARSPDKVFYKIGESLDLTGISVVLIRNDGSEEELTDYETSGFDSSKAGAKNITVFYNKIINGINTYVGSDTFQIKVTKDGTNPFEDNTEPITVVVHWIDGEFEDLTSENKNIKSNTLVLQESICSESYFIFGGCISNQISFEVEHEQFYGTGEDSYPSGRIEVYLECKETKLKIFTGRIASAERTSIWSTRKIVAYDYLYDLRNTDIARWYKNQTTDKNKILTQKEFRDKLFEYLGIEQVPTTLHWDKTYVPNTQNSNEMNAVNILKDLCLQNDRFGHMNRDGKFEYLKLRQNSYEYGETNAGKKLYKYYDNAEVHLDTFKSFSAQEGRIWFPHTIFTDPEPSRAYGFTQGDLTAQEAYESNVFYNRNSFFVGNEDWLNYVWNADEYNQISRKKPIMDICYGTFVNLDLRKFYRAQGYTAEVSGNPYNTVGQTIELRETRQMEDGTELEWYVHSYIMSRTLRLGNSKLIDTYSANNAPYNSNSRQLGKDTPEISATVNKTRSELPVISYEEFTDGSDFSTQSVDGTVKKANFRCMKKIDRSAYKDLVAIGAARKDTLYFSYEAERGDEDSYTIQVAYWNEGVSWPPKDSSHLPNEVRYSQAVIIYSTNKEDYQAGAAYYIDESTIYFMFELKNSGSQMHSLIKNMKVIYREYDENSNQISEKIDWETSELVKRKENTTVYCAGSVTAGYPLRFYGIQYSGLIISTKYKKCESYEELKEYMGVS